MRMNYINNICSLASWPARPIPPLSFAALMFTCEGKGVATLVNEALSNNYDFNFRAIFGNGRHTLY